MPINSDILNNAEQFRSKMFGGYESALSYTDPEFVQIFENFAFGDVVSASKIDDKTRLKAILASLIGAQGADAFRTMLPGALEIGVTPDEVKEIVYQATPYVGLARVLPYILIVNERLRGRSIRLPLSPKKTTTRAEHLQRGNDIQVEVFGEDMRNNWENASAESALVREWLAANCYGDYYTREGMSLGDREMITLCFLAAQGGCDDYVRSHAAGNMRIGNGKEFLVDILQNLIPYIGYPRVMKAIACVEAAAADTEQ